MSYGSPKACEKTACARSETEKGWVIASKAFRMQMNNPKEPHDTHTEKRNAG